MVYKKYVKHRIDFVVSIILLLITLPVLILAILGLTISNRSFDFLFKQKRPGFRGKIFILYKLKTLKDLDNNNLKVLKDSERVTKLGRILRKYSVDELPQLLNIIKGNMSLIGPRPLLPEYLKHYSSEQAKRHDVKPGITGWAQINGRNSMSFNERLKYDVWYVKNLSLILDLKILIMTICYVFKSSDVLADDPNIFIDQVHRDNG